MDINFETFNTFHVKQYAARSTKLADIDKSLLGDLSELEHHLMNSQDLMTVIIRGKVMFSRNS